MEGHHIKSLMEAYSSIYNDAEEVLYLVEDNLGEEVEILDESKVILEFESDEDIAAQLKQAEERRRAKIERDRLIQQAGGGAAGEAERRRGKEAQLNKEIPPGSFMWSRDRTARSDAALDRDARYRTRQTGEANLRRLGGGDLEKGIEAFRKKQEAEKRAAAAAKAKDNQNQGGGNRPAGGNNPAGGNRPAGGNNPPSRPVSQSVLAKKGGVEGRLDKATGKFTAGNFSDAEKARYNKVAGQKNNAAANANYQKDRAAISTAKTPEAKAAATKKAEKTGMDAWAKANPKLAAAKAERDRTRGTSASTNPQMKGMPGQNKAELEKLRGNAAINSISKSPSAKKILNTSKIGQASLNRSEFGSATKPAPAPKSAAPTSLNKTGPGAKFNPSAPKINLKQDLDIFDLVKGYLLDEGYAETEQAAMTIMANMSEEWRQDIIEFFGPKTVTPKDSPSGTKSVQVGKKYPAQLNGRMVNVQYDKSGNKSTKEMTGMERGIQALKMRNTGHSSMSPRP